MILLILIKVLIVTEICQSFKINQTSLYDNKTKSIHDGKTTETSHGVATTKKARTVKGITYANNDADGVYGLKITPNFRNGDHNININGSSSSTSQPFESSLETRFFSHTLPYKSGVISNILSQSQPASLQVYSNIYPIQYQYHNPHFFLQEETATPLIQNQESQNEPVTAATLKTDILHPSKESDSLTLKYNISRPSVNYNNQIYHNSPRRGIDEEQSSYASPQYPYFIRKQRNLNENHYDDDKLIEHNFTEIRDDNENNNQDFNTAASLVEKQPSSASHEIRYLHDIFLNYPKSHHANYGHIQLSPYLFEKRFESLKAGNRYKGEVIWLDNTGGYAQHYWNMAQGTL